MKVCVEGISNPYGAWLKRKIFRKTSKVLKRSKFEKKIPPK
jgi:hypothetical protein